MNGMDSLEQVSTILRLKPEIVEKAQDLVRLMHLKLQPGSLRKAEHCRHVLAVDLAAQSFNEPCRREALLPHAGLSEKDYGQALMIVRNNLGIKLNENVIHSLSILFGCESIGEVALDILSKYEENYVSKLDIHRRKNIYLKDPKYQAAAFLLATKMKKITVDKKRVIEASGVVTGVFHQLYDSIVKNTGNEASDPAPAPVINKRLRVLKEASASHISVEKENRLNSSSSRGSCGSSGTGNVQKMRGPQSNGILDKSNFRSSINDLNEQTLSAGNADHQHYSPAGMKSSSATEMVHGVGLSRGVDKNAGLSSRQLETLRAVQEHSREEELSEQKKRKAESDKFEKFKEHVRRKQMLRKQQEQERTVEIIDS